MIIEINTHMKSDLIKSNKKISCKNAHVRKYYHFMGKSSKNYIIFNQIEKI
jgi:hypothetical protein